MSDPLERLLNRLDGVEETNTGFKALCPVHEDENPSLAVSIGKGGRILIRCCGGCRTEKVLSKLKLTWGDLFMDCINPAYPVAGSARSAVDALDCDAPNVDLRDTVYRAFMQHLPLRDKDRDWLRRKGIEKTEEYRTLTLMDAFSSIAKMRKEINIELITQVPGFRKVGDRVEIPVAGGILIPIKTLSGKIQGLQVRTGAKSAKYLWFSSKGNSVGSPLHQINAAEAGPHPATAYVTEGQIKAEVLADRTRVGYVLGAAGVNNTRLVLPFCRKYNVQRVYLYFDMDWQKKEGVKNSLKSLFHTLDKAGLGVRIAVWDERYNGIDDYYLSGRSEVEFRRLVC